MKRIIITFITVFSMCCLVACGSETTDDVATGSNNEVVVNNDDDNPVVTTEATAEPTKEPSSDVADVEPTEEPAAEETPEPTEEPVLYPGIDMESDLSGEEWVATFIGVIEEPKVVIYNDETGRKEIVEEDTKVPFNPDKDTFVLYVPEGYERLNEVMGLEISESYRKDFGVILVLNPEKTREKKFENVAVYVEKDNEKIEIAFTLKSE